MCSALGGFSRGEGGMPGAKRLALDGDGDIWASDLGDAISIRAEHEDDATETGIAGSVGNVTDHWDAGYGVEHLRKRRAHARATPGSEDYGGPVLERSGIR